METQELALAAKAGAVAALITQANSATVSTRQDHSDVGILVDAIRQLEKELELEYESLEVVQTARKIQKIKGAMSRDLEDARKTAKKRMTDYEAKLDAERAEAERVAQIEARKLAEQAALEAAVEAEQAGDVAQAEAIINEPVVAATIVVPEEKLKAKGHTRRRVYKARIIDPSLVPDEYWCLDTSKIDATIRARKEEGQGVIPGVLAYSEVV